MALLRNALAPKLLCAVAIAALCASPLALVGCDATAGSASSGQVSQQTTAGRRFTVPQAFFGSKDEKSAISKLESYGGSDVERDGEGNYLVTMSDGNYERFCEDSLVSTCKVLDAIPGSRDYPQIVAVDYNDDLAQITFTCAKDDMGNQGQNAASLAIYVVALHQVIAGRSLECNVTLQNSSGSTIATFSYPQLG